MSQSRPIRADLAPRVALLLALSAVLLVGFAAPASAITRTHAASKALTALGARKGSDSVTVLGLRKPLPAGTRVNTQKPSRLVIQVGHERAFFFYQRSTQKGRVALVGVQSGKVRLSKSFARSLLVTGKLYRVFYRAAASSPAAPAPLTASAPNAFSPVTPVGIAAGNRTPKADKQDARVKQNSPKHITLTASDEDGDFLIFAITQEPDHGTLSGAAPNLIYTPNPNYLGKDKFAFKAYDDTSQSNTAHVSIDVVPLGQPPTTTTTAGCTAYNARAAAVVVDGLITASDPDDTTLDSATVRISANFQNGDDLLFTDQNGISGSYDDTTGVLTLSGTASVANYQAALRSVRFRNLSTGSPFTSKTVEFTVNDAGADSAPTTRALCITPGGPNHKPIGESTGEGAVLYTENDGAVPVDGSFAVVDPDSANLIGATIKFTSSQGSQDEEVGGGPGTTVFNFFPAEDQLGFTNQNGIAGAYNAATGVLTLSGSASVADYQAAIQSVTYTNSSEDPSPETRTIRFQVTDSSGDSSVPSTRDLSVSPVNDQPFVTPSAGSMAYTEGDPLTTIDSALTAGDVDNTTLTGGQVRISIGFQPGDELVFVDQLGISGVYDSGTGVLTLTGTASTADYQAALRSVEYRQTGDNPSALKTVEYSVNDGQLDSNASTKDIAVTGVNDKPVLDSTGTALSYTENAGAVAVDSGITASDPDSTTLAGATVKITGNLSASEDALAFTDQNGISGAYNSGSGTLTLSGTASVAEYEAALRSVTYENGSDNPSTATRTVTFQVDDGAASDNVSDAVTRDIEITPVNDAPVVTTSPGSTSYGSGDPAVTVDSGVTVADADDTNIESAQVRISTDFTAGDELVFVNQPGIDGVYDTGTGVLTLTGSASVADYQAALQSIKFRDAGSGAGTSRTIEFVVNDGDVDSNAATKSIDIGPPTV